MSPLGHEKRERSALRKRRPGKPDANLMTEKAKFFSLTLKGLAHKTKTAPI
jgi:hypothetical protein